MNKTVNQNVLAERLIEKLNNKQATIGVVGLGYVGLPLAVEKAKAGYKVIGFDVQEDKVRKVNKAENYIGDVIPTDLESLIYDGKLMATSDYAFIKEVDAIAICVPTPLDIYKQPNMKYVESSARAIAANLQKGTLVVLESTTYPGTTEELIKPILEEKGFVCGKDFFLAYSPERVDPGNKDFNTKNTPKVVGGMTSTCTEVAATMYENVLEGTVHKVSSPAVAEMEKILENTFRNINIALANEMAILCNKMGIDVWEVIDAAATKPYGFMPFYPGPGLGGHCIPIDPWYLTWKAREFNYHTRLIETAGEINDSMSDFVVNKIVNIMNGLQKSINGANLLIFGVAYKKNIGDYRESPVIPIIQTLEKLGANCTIVDPFVPEYKINGVYRKTIEYSTELFYNSDLTLITTDHDQFDFSEIKLLSKNIFDTRNVYKNNNTSKIFKL